MAAASLDTTKVIFLFSQAMLSDLSFYALFFFPQV